MDLYKGSCAVNSGSPSNVQILPQHEKTEKETKARKTDSAKA